jgi:hypothetical protein
MSADPYTQEQWWTMCDAHIGPPVPLQDFDLTADPWVYYRPWGVMHVPFGCHQLAMATLYAFHKGHAGSIEAAQALKVPSYRATETLADRFLTELEGTAFRSSTSLRSVVAGRREHLDSRERQAFRSFTIQYLED